MHDSNDDGLNFWRGCMNVALIYWYCILIVALIYWIF